jgi:hypothetical protein
MQISLCDPNDLVINGNHLMVLMRYHKCIYNSCTPYFSRDSKRRVDLHYSKSIFRALIFVTVLASKFHPSDLDRALEFRAGVAETVSYA